MKVTTTIDREPLQDAFFERVDRAMRAAGWRAASTAPYVIAPMEGRYFRALDGSLVSVATLGYDGVYEEPKTTERYAEASVGVTFPAAERLLAALRAPHDVTVAEDAALAAGLDDDFYRPIAEDVPDVDALVACHLDHDDQDDLARYKHPAILAALGRTDDARRALARYRRDPADPRFDAYADELRARLAGGATVPGPSDHAFPPAPVPFSTTIDMTWADIEPGHRLRVFGLMLRLLGSRTTPSNSARALRPAALIRRRSLSAWSRTWSGPRRRGTSWSRPGSGSPGCPGP